MRSWRSSRLQHLGVMCAIAVVLVACGRDVKGSGNVVNETRAISPFHEVTLYVTGHLIIEQVEPSEAPSLILEGEDNVLTTIKTGTVGTTLSIGMIGGTAFAATKPLTFRLKAHSLTKLNVSLGTVTATKLSGERLDVHLSGVGHANLSGTVINQTLEITGPGVYDGADLNSRSAKVNVTGGGIATVNASDKLEVTIVGLGNVAYLNNPVLSQNISGIGFLNALKSP